MKLNDPHTGRAERPRPPPLGWDYEDLPTPKVDGPAVQSLGPNERGRDLVIGDIHGQRETFERVLETVRYSPEGGDRVLLLGDVIDRGPDSTGMLHWLRRDGVTCIRGNHEQLMLDALEGNEEIEALWTERNGGAWAQALDSHERDEWHEVLRALPLALEVEGAQGRFVLVHAEIPEETPWWALKAWLEEGDRRAGILALWARERFMNSPERDPGVPDAWRTFHGHVPLRELRQVGNMRWIDAGAAYAHMYDGAAVACVPIGSDGSEQDPVLVKVLEVDPQQARAPRAAGH
jgi:serine/threonine protein phosphatase 1